MPFQGISPYGTNGGEDSTIIPQSPEVWRKAPGNVYILLLRTNGPITEKIRDQVEDVVRVLGLAGQLLMPIVIRDDGTVIDAATNDLNFVAGLAINQISPGVLEVNIPNNGITANMIPDGSIGVIKFVQADFQENVRDTIAAALVAGTGMSVTVNDALNTITIAAAADQAAIDENVRDIISAALVAGAGVTITPNDVGDTITIAMNFAGTGVANTAARSDHTHATAPGTFVTGTIGIVSDAITLPDVLGAGIIYCTVDTEGAAGTDNLATVSITGTVTEGTILILRTANSTRDVVCTETGNLDLAGSVRSLTDVLDMVVVVRKGSRWNQLVFANNA